MNLLLRWKRGTGASPFWVKTIQQCLSWIWLSRFSLIWRWGLYDLCCQWRNSCLLASLLSSSHVSIMQSVLHILRSVPTDFFPLTDSSCCFPGSSLVFMKAVRSPLPTMLWPRSTLTATTTPSASCERTRTMTAAWWESTARRETLTWPVWRMNEDSVTRSWSTWGGHFSRSSGVVP